MLDYKIKAILQSHFKDFFRVEYKRPELLQLLLPLYYPDGDMIDIFLKIEDDGFHICDCGLTLMRLSYDFSIDSPTKEKIFNRILAENNITNDNGNLEIITSQEELLIPAILQFSQAVAKVSNMHLYKKEVVHSLFFEMLNEFVLEDLSDYKPAKKYYPIPGHTEYEVDYCINSRSRPIFIFGVNSDSAARLTTISCQKFITDKIPFRSFIILDSMECISKKDAQRLMSAADKQFPSLDDFKAHAVEFIERFN